SDPAPPGRPAPRSPPPAAAAPARTGRRAAAAHRPRPRPPADGRTPGARRRPHPRLLQPALTTSPPEPDEFSTGGDRTEANRGSLLQSPRASSAVGWAENRRTCSTRSENVPESEIF